MTRFCGEILRKNGLLVITDEENKAGGSVPAEGFETSSVGENHLRHGRAKEVV